MPRILLPAMYFSVRRSHRPLAVAIRHSSTWRISSAQVWVEAWSVNHCASRLLISVSGMSIQSRTMTRLWLADSVSP